ncbi:predicted protein [Sclerotinia sclerotiorum 1980 UF-70]|uniref:Uncharacterized protein n=2 Tax=Sclerotinia sclerotiorum (strain ATCC 18683 / 1980 / Ss-1) TaxID=665079 RepID=A7F5K0_SCLS1|nr:predicted protein [Sclerotinia sclerotiorum 1980 UF-70]APA06447.1 hypothetical protein sscle_02g012170 [Sclerotinia sclerotiorum 1980 UF-70]EDN98021.1 predicted protein [Sclerotinia sclerotiorum 1980 UF-70]
MPDSKANANPNLGQNQPSKITSAIHDMLPSLKPPGVQNIENAHTRAGGSANHTPGYASTLGSQDQRGRTDEYRGVDSEKFKEGILDQRTEPSALGKAFHNIMTGTDKSK